MGIYDPRIVYPPEADEITWNPDEDCGIEEKFGNDPMELSPDELQYLNEYSTRDIEESLFYKQGEPVWNLQPSIHL